ncbi:MAG: helix-turn-helix transcriptional regulator [Dysgonomonas mossii]|nr:helix-turn-helix transcriptional regulator [Dysgonomonas mossii]
MGLRINEILEEKGISIAELGRRINKSRSTMHATLEKGNPQYSTLVEIADAIGVDVTELFDPTQKDGLIGVIRYNNKSYEINSIEDIKKLLSEIEDSKS